MLPPPSPTEKKVEPPTSDVNQPKQITVQPKRAASPQRADSVVQAQPLASKLDDSQKAGGPLCTKSSAAPKTRPSSADKARPTTAGPKRNSKSRPSSAGRREVLKPTIWLEPTAAKQLHEAEQGLKDIFSKRPRSAGSRKKNKSNTQKNKANARSDRPNSAERTREGEGVKNSVWLTDKTTPAVMKINCDTKDQNARPGSAGRKRSVGLAPLKGTAAASSDQNAVKRPHTP